MSIDVSYLSVVLRIKSGTRAHLSTIAFNGHQIAPFLNCLSQVHLAQGDLHLADLVMLGEPIEVVNAEHKGLAHDVGIGDLLGERADSG